MNLITGHWDYTFVSSVQVPWSKWVSLTTVELQERNIVESVNLEYV